MAGFRRKQIAALAGLALSCFSKPYSSGAAALRHNRRLRHQSAIAARQFNFVIPASR
jgi:hypothetical protein